MTSVQKGMNRMNDITKCYPNNPEAETSIIGSMLLDNNLITPTALCIKRFRQ